MSDYEALKIFARQPVSNAMVDVLVATTSSVIQIRPAAKTYQQMGPVLVAPAPQSVPLKKFIRRLIEYSNVQTPTLMTSLVYLNRLRNILPGNAVGMETTRHRIFLASLILSAKSLNDSSPLNKHWTKYTDGLLLNTDVNLAERELINLLNWNLTVSTLELVLVLQPFLLDIKLHLHKKHLAESVAKADYYRLSSYPANSASNSSIASYNSKASSYTINSVLSLKSLACSLHSLASATPRLALREKPLGALNASRCTDFDGTKQYGSSLHVPKPSSAHRYI